MLKAYSVIMTVIALGLLVYILNMSQPSPDPVRVSAQYTDAPRISGFFSQQMSDLSDITRSAPSEKKKTYVLNTNTRKFHNPSCSSVRQMKESNKRTVTSTRQEIINQGYDPCGRCHP